MNSGNLDQSSQVPDNRPEALRAADRDREALRKKHGLALVSEADDGAGIHRVPEGVYGFTYAPGVSDCPMFRKSGRWTFEVHKRSGNEWIIGFVSADAAARIRSATDDFDLVLRPVPEGDMNELVEVPVSRVLDVKLQTYRETGALGLRLAPAE